MCIAMGWVKLVTENGAYGNIGLLPGEPVSINLNDGVQPYCLNVARIIPMPLIEKVNSELQRMEKDDIIRNIETATDWCSPTVPVLKRNGHVRI